LKGARRRLGVAKKDKDPLLVNDVRRLVAVCPSRSLGLRHRVLVLIGFAGAFRRSELASICMADLTFSDNGLVINIPHSKTGQEGVGREVAIPFGENEETCPARALRAWVVERRWGQ
jgi:integrase